MKIIKASCNGNSFLYIEHKFYNQINIKEICNKFNYDCDGVFFFHESKKGNYCINLFNKDGSVATFCGNGLICFAKIFMKDNLKTNIYFNKKKYLLVKEENEVFLRWLLIQRTKYCKMYHKNHKGWYIDKGIKEGKRFFLEQLGFKVIDIPDYNTLYQVLENYEVQI